MNPESHHEFHIFSFQSSKWKALQDVDVGAMGRRKSNFLPFEEIFSHDRDKSAPGPPQIIPGGEQQEGILFWRGKYHYFAPFQWFWICWYSLWCIEWAMKPMRDGEIGVLSVCYISYLTGREFSLTKDNFDKICGHNILLSCKMAILFFRLRFQINDGQRPKWSSPKSSFICCQILCERKWGLGKKRIWPNMKRPRFLTLRKMGWARTFLHH